MRSETRKKQRGSREKQRGAEIEQREAEREARKLGDPPHPRSGSRVEPP